MDSNYISLTKAIFLIKNNKFKNNYKIDFKDEKVNAFDAILLGKNDIDVPDDIIEYDDDKIDYSDIPEITDKDIATGKIKWTLNAEISLDSDVREWIKTENININKFAAKLIKNFYESIKFLPKNAAL